MTDSDNVFRSNLGQPIDQIISEHRPIFERVHGRAIPPKGSGVKRNYVKFFKKRFQRPDISSWRKPIGVRQMKKWFLRFGIKVVEVQY
jgi:hypothetical protein